MQKNLKKVLSFVLTLVMALGIVAPAISVFADEAASIAELPTAMDGLNIAYPYNSETVMQTGTPADRFDALTFESARGEVESAQMILTPNFKVDSFELTMNSLKNENGNIIPSWAFEVYIQHYVTVSGSGNAINYSEQYDMYNPTYSKNGYDGTFPDALLPQDVAIANGENTIAAGNNQGIWVNLNVSNAAPGTYTGFATLTVNGTDMQIPVSVHIYDVQIPEQVHTKSSIGIWWDMVQAGEGYIDRELADAYFEYVVSKRLMPLDAWSLNRWNDSFAEYAATYLAVAPEISSYSLYIVENSDGTVNTDELKTTLTTLINKNIQLAQSGSNVDLFKKAYFSWIIDEPRDDEEYAFVNTITAQLDAVKAEMAPLLADYPAIQESFMNLKQLVTAPDPTDKTYAKVGSFFNYFINDDYGNTKLTGDSYIYCPQYQWLNTETQRARYANEEELWWYGCCHPIAPYPTYHINTPLVSARLEGWMRYAYGIDGFVYAGLNQWGYYDEKNNNAIIQYDYWNGYTNSGTPGDQILILPGSDYGVLGPIGTIRIENIREANEDYEYLWMLENQFDTGISTYTAGMFEGTIPTEDVSAYYNKRTALLEKLEDLSIAAYGETEIAPGQEGFIRGDYYAAGADATIQLDETVTAAGLSFEYKLNSGKNFNIGIMADWNNYYSYYAFGASGPVDAYAGVSYELLDYGYIRVVMDFAALTKVTGTPGGNIDFVYVRGNWSDADFYLDNLELLTELPEIEKPTEPPTTEAPATEPPATEAPAPEAPKQQFEGGAFAATTGATIVIDNKQPVTKMTFDYKIDSGDYFHIALMPDWSNYYGYFKFDANGVVGSYTGIATSKQSDGSIRVYVDLPAVTTIANNPSDVLTMLYVRGNWTTANGSISNICINDAAESAPRGEAFFVENKTILLNNAKELKTVSFEYKIVEGDRFNIALMPGWSDFYGYFAFNKNGSVEAYDGVTCQTLDDGYIRVTFDMAALTKVSGTPTTNVEFLFIRGDWTDANGYIDNIEYTEGCSHSYDAVVTAPDCKNGGYTTYTCSKCGESYVGDYTDAVDHSYEAVVTAPTFTANGYTTHTCKFCGDSYVTDEVAAYTFDVAQWNITLADDIRANFYLDVDNRAEGAAVSVTVAGQTNSTPVSSLTQVEGSYEITVNLAAAQMTDEITVQVICGEAVSAEKTYTLRQYAEYILAGEYEDNTKALVQNMLHYGAAAQNYFGYNKDNLANKDYEITEVPEIPQAEAGAITQGTVNGIRFYGASLLYKTRIGVRFYFTVTGDIHSYTFSNGATPVAKSGMYYVDVLNINPNDYDQLIALSVTDGADVLEVCYSPLHYISRKYYGSSEQSLKDLVAAMYQYYQAAETYLGDDVDVPEETYRGEAIAAGVDKTIALNNQAQLETLSFDYKVLSGTFNIALMADWSNMYGYFAFNEGGNVDPYDGVSLETLEDGYIRVTFDIAALTKTTGTPAGVVDLLYIRGNWTDANGYIDNVTYTVYEPKLEFEGGAFAPTTGAVISLENDQAVTSLNFDYTIEEGAYFHIAFMPDWSNYYGYFKFDANGVVGSYAGISTGKRADGSVRVYVDLTAVTTIANDPSNVLTMLYVRGDWTDASGAISNIRINGAAESAPRGEAIAAGTNKTILLNNNEQLATVSFEYKIMEGERFNIALMPDWSNFYGYYGFTAAGSSEAGVTTEVLEDGYIRATFDLAALTKINGAPTNIVDFLFVRGDWTDAYGYIDNVTYTVYEPVQEFEGGAFAPTTGAVISLENDQAVTSLNFDYTIEAGEYFHIAFMPDWSNYYGYFKFDANGVVGSYAGIVTGKQSDGSVRVYVDLTAVTAIANNPSNVITMLYVRGDWTNASGAISNIRINGAAESAPRGDAFTPGVSKTIVLNNTASLETLSFEYKIVDGTKFNVALMPDWSNYYGYFSFGINGANENYAGVTTETLDDGYIRVTFDIAAITKLSGAPSSAIQLLFVRGDDWSDSNGYIDSVQFNQ